MSNVLALDIETKNLSTEIGGWGNTHMFLVSTVATWDGNIGKIYVEKDIQNHLVAKSNVQILPLRQLKYDLDEALEKNVKLLGHNIASFDLPVLKNSLDIYCIKGFLNKKQYIDTSREMTKQHGERFTLQNLVDNTLGESKSLESALAPSLWKAGNYQEVVDYCLKDCELVYDLWKHGQGKTIKGFSIEEEKVKTMEVEW
jgi:DNA polymerase elongation subunit (family B)